MVKCLPEFKFFFTVLLKNRNFISKIRRSKITDYAALKHKIVSLRCHEVYETYNNGQNNNKILSGR